MASITIQKIANAIHTAIQRLLLIDRNYCDAGLELPMYSDPGTSFDKLRMTLGGGAGYFGRLASSWTKKMLPAQTSRPAATPM